MPKLRLNSYGATFAGWLFAAFTNTHLSQYLGVGSMMALGAVFQMVAHALRAWMPPFGLFVTTFFLVAVGQAYNDTHANTFVAGVKGAHRWLAVIHASFMVSPSAPPDLAIPTYIEYGPTLYVYKRVGALSVLSWPRP